jgi:hypothetical protein
MTKIGQAATHIEQSIPCFGLRVERHQAEYLAGLYIYQRPDKPVHQVIEMMLGVPNLAWEPDDSQMIKMSVMRSLIEHLDSLYLVDTFEHDGGKEE